MNLKNYTCCFTGHRSQKLPWGYNENDVRFKRVVFNTKNIIEYLINNGVSYFITGMATGFDMICAKIVLELKEKYNNIFLECAIPCKNQFIKWSNMEKVKYLEIIDNADKITYLQEFYSSYCMIKRNKYMVEKSDIVLALFNNIPGGTKFTVEYAQKLKKFIIVLKP